MKHCCIQLQCSEDWFWENTLHLIKCKKSHPESLLSTIALGPGSILWCWYNFDYWSFWFCQIGDVLALEIVISRPESLPNPCTCGKCSQKNGCYCRVTGLMCCKYCKCKADDFFQWMRNTLLYYIYTFWLQCVNHIPWGESKLKALL